MIFVVLMWTWRKPQNSVTVTHRKYWVFNIYFKNLSVFTAFSYLFGDNRWSIDEAREIFERLAKTGSPDANLGLGFIYSTGLGLEKPDPARGLLHYTFSALGGNPLAQMAVVRF